MQLMRNSILVNTTWTTNWNTWMLKSWSLVYRFCIYRYWFVDIISVYNFNLVSKKVFHWSQNGRLKIFPPLKTKHGSNQRLRVGFVSCLLSNRFPLWSSCPAFCLNHKTSVFRPPRRHLTEPGFTQALRCLSTFALSHAHVWKELSWCFHNKHNRSFLRSAFSPLFITSVNTLRTAGDSGSYSSQMWFILFSVRTSGLVKCSQND